MSKWVWVDMEEGYRVFYARMRNNFPNGFKEVTRFSPAKLNLGLRIVGRRKDGYHLIQSLFWPIDFGDSVRLLAGTGSKGHSLVWAKSAPIQNPLPPSEENLVTKLFKKLNLEGYSSEICKNIPLGSGLGGASSNVAQILRILKDHYQWKEGDCYKLALQLGADVPFFLQSHPAWVTGVGEEIHPIELEKNILDSLVFYLILSPEAIPTVSVFNEYRQSALAFSESVEALPRILDLKTLIYYLQHAKNDLESVVLQSYPTIGKCIDYLRRHACLYAGLSGSGSTCFGVFLAGTEPPPKDLEEFCRKHGCRSVRVLTHSS